MRSIVSTFTLGVCLVVAACAGPAGSEGSTGATGATGSNGSPGVEGPTGSPGATGAAGTNGTNGTNGTDGANGATGAAGATGAMGATGADGTNGTNGSTGATGNNGADAPTTGIVNVTVNDGTGATATLASGVTVSAETTTGGAIPAESGLVLSGTTGSAGTVALTLPIGVFNLTFSEPEYTSPAPIEVGIVGGQQIAVTVSMALSSSSKPVITLAANPTPTIDVGYNTAVNVSASGASPLGDSLTYTWSQTTVVGTVVGSGTTGTLTTPTVQAAMAPQPDPTATGWNLGNFTSGYTIPLRFGVLPIIDDTAGTVTASVTATDQHGQSTTATMSVTSSSTLQNPTQNKAVGTRIYMNPGPALPTSGAFGSGCTGGWTISGPAGSTAAFDNACNQYPSFIPDKLGAYTLSLGGNSIAIYAGAWVGAIGPGSTQTATPWNGDVPVPFGFNSNCTVCHQTGIALDLFTPWIATRHAVHETYGMDGVVSSYESFSSGEGCLGCHSVGFDNGDTNPLAGGTSQVAAAQTPPWTYPTTINAGNWAAVPPAVQQLANIQCESCHGPNNSAAHMQTKLASGTLDPVQSPRVSYAAEDCGTCHAAGTTHHDYSEWATLDPTHPGLNPLGEGHSNLSVAQSEGLTSVDGGSGLPLVTELNSSCGRCHTAQGYTEYVSNLEAGNVGTLSPTQELPGEINANNVEPQTCAACHDPHSDAIDPNTLADEYQLRIWDKVSMLPSGFGVTGAGARAVCITCHNSRNGAYNVSTVDNSTTTAYLHEDTDWIGSNPGASNAALVSANYPSLGSSFGSLGGPHEANQGDVFEGHNAYFLGDQTPVVSPHSAVKDTCVGCHMENQPQTYTSHGAVSPAMHLFAIRNDPNDIAALCSNCHAAGTDNVNGAELQAATVSGLTTIVNNMAEAVMKRVNDASGATAPAGYGAWADTGVINIAAKSAVDSTPGCTPATGSTCGLSNSATLTINTVANPVKSVVVTPEGRSGIMVVLTFTNGVAFTNGTASGTPTVLTVSSLANVKDNSASPGPYPLFASNGNMFKANWNYSLISQDESYGVHNPPFVSAVLSATANPPGDPWATPPSVPGLGY